MYNWFYKEEEIDDISKFPEGTVAFVYKITRLSDGKFYVGKKSLYSNRTKPLTKKELAEQTDKRKSKKKKVTSESDWKTYYGSDIALKEAVKKEGPECFKREILVFCTNKKQASYQEVRHQILNDCLESNNCWNGQILGKFWRKDV
jgi:hypothetical protein